MTSRLAKEAPGSYFVFMRAIGLKVLKNRLSEYVRLVAAGETVLVTDRDRVVAELVPPREGRSLLASDAMLAEAVRQGLITPHALARSEPLPVRKPTAKLAAILRELDRDRGER